MKKINRSLINFKSSERFTYSEGEDFASNVMKNGVHSLKINNRWFDAGYETRGSDSLLICFHAAVGGNLKSSPVLSGRAVASEIGSDWVAFADPSVSHPDGLETGWHLSTKRVPAQELVRSTINELRESGKYKNLIFFGSSAGGFGALNHSYQVPGSIAVVMNPVIEIRQESKRYWDAFCASAYVGWPPEKIENKLTTSMSEVYAGQMKNRVVYIQNLQDDHYLSKHYLRFVKEVSDKSRVLTYCGNWGQGHVVPPRWVYTQALRQVMETAGEWNRLFNMKVTNPE